MLNGRLEPCGYVDGFTSELGASGLFCPRHLTLPVAAAFFNLSDDGGPSPYLVSVQSLIKLGNTVGVVLICVNLPRGMLICPVWGREATTCHDKGQCNS